MPQRRRRALGYYGAGSALQELHTARPNQSTIGMASTNPRGGSMGLQAPPYAVLSPLVTSPPRPPPPTVRLFPLCLQVDGAGHAAQTDDERLHDETRDDSQHARDVEAHGRHQRTEPPRCPTKAEPFLQRRVSWCCLLYTSPSPRDATLSRMPSSA